HRPVTGDELAPVAPRARLRLRLCGRQQRLRPCGVTALPGAVQPGEIFVLPAQEGAPGDVAGNGDVEFRRESGLELAPVAIARVSRVAPGRLRRILERREGERKPLEGIPVGAV